VGFFRKLILLLFPVLLTAPMLAGSVHPSYAYQQEASAQGAGPKYIFIIIGDGMGQGHLALGSVYQKILYGDPGYEPAWESFTTKRTVDAREESASGGTALACGELTLPSIVGENSAGQELVTILDLARERGMSTAIATNAAITDATPAAFSAHAVNRRDFNDIASDIASSGVTIMLGSGMGYLLHSSDRTARNSTDAAGVAVAFMASDSYLDLYSQNGYHVFSGLQGAKDFFSVQTLPEKYIGVFCNGSLPFQATRLLERWEPAMHFIPTLMNFTRRGIESLSRDEDGFVFVIEQGLIDKSCHIQKLDFAAMEIEPHAPDHIGFLQ